MRSYKAASETLFKHLCPPGERDGVMAEYYIHTWTSLGPGGSGWDAPASTELDLSELSSVYRPAGLAVERHNPESWPARSMFRKIKLAHELAARTGRDYDLYVRARPDSFFVDKIPIPEIRAGVVYVPDRAGFGGTCDQFAMGDYHAMSRYSGLIDAQARDDHFHPETRLKSYLCDKDVETIAVRFKILRYDGTLYDTMCIGS